MRIRIEPIFESKNKIFMPLTKVFVGAKTPRRKAIKLGAIKIVRKNTMHLDNAQILTNYLKNKKIYCFSY